MKKMVGEKRKTALLRKNRLDEEAKRLERHRNTFGEFGSSQDQPDGSQNATGDPFTEDQNGPHANESEAPEPPPEKRRRITSKTKYMEVAAKIKVLKSHVKAEWVEHGRSSSSRPVKKTEGGSGKQAYRSYAVIDELRGPRVDASTDTAKVDIMGIDRPHHKMKIRVIIF